MINVTKPFLPPEKDYIDTLMGIWSRGVLTNNGPLVQQLESDISSFSSNQNFLFLGNGTIALQFAIQGLDLKGEIITTPFSYVASTSTIVWEGCKPIFTDIDPDTFNLDPSKIEKKITSKTTAILATHSFGNACDIVAIEKIAKRNGLKVIFDASHCFGTKYNGKSIFSFGDVSTASFHATKIFHTIEGGGVFCNDLAAFEKIKFFRNFGHDGPEKFRMVGINGKNSEFHAGMGLCVMNYFPQILMSRKSQYNFYFNELSENKKLKFLKIQDGCESNYSYFPLLFQNENVLLNVVKVLNENNIFPRRYFYPLLSKLNYVSDSLDLNNAEFIAPRILCLPMFFELTEAEQLSICKLIKSAL